MRTLKQLTSAGVLTIIFSISVLAGDIQIPAPIPPPATSSVTTLGDISIPGSSSAVPQPDYSAADVAFNLLQAVLTVF